ncbi:stage II sporulation protein P, partial [Anaerotruncus rubiinfantis]
ERSAETIKGYLKKYPTIKIALDIHRDGIQREDDLIVKPVVEVDGKKASQLMIITGSDDGTMNVPKWRENLRFAASVQDAIEQDFPGLTRPIFFCYRKYNMDLTTGSLLFEVGSNANTLEESKYTAGLIGQSIAKLLNANREVTAEKPNPTPVQ